LPCRGHGSADAREWTIERADRRLKQKAKPFLKAFVFILIFVYTMPATSPSTTLWRNSGKEIVKCFYIGAIEIVGRTDEDELQQVRGACEEEGVPAEVYL
jgi:hypothetical protein